MLYVCHFGSRLMLGLEPMACIINNFTHHFSTRPPCSVCGANGGDVFCCRGPGLLLDLGIGCAFAPGRLARWSVAVWQIGPCLIYLQVRPFGGPCCALPPPEPEASHRRRRPARFPLSQRDAAVGGSVFTCDAHTLSINQT